MENSSNDRVDFKQFRRSAIKAHRLLLKDLSARGAAPPAEVERTARITTFRLLYFLSAGCRGLMDIPDYRKSPRPFMQNIHRWVRDNPPHARRYFSYGDLFEPSRQPLLWQLHPSDDAIKEAIAMLVEIEPSTWAANWPASLYPYFIDPQARRESGSYYTPNPVVRHIVSRALGPLCYRSPERRRGLRDPEEILSARVLDPSMGDGRFLMASVDYLADALAQSRSEKLDIEHRVETARHCIYGVDRDPTVVDLARIALWLHLGDAGVETDFLRQHIQPGDALMGATLDEMEKSFDEFDKDATQLALFKPEAQPPPPVSLRKVAQSGRMIDRIKSLAHLWTSIFMDNEPAIELFGAARSAVYRASEERWVEIESHPAMGFAHGLAAEHGFLHWELRFPEVFFPRDDRQGGFNAVVGNPPYRKERGYGERSLSRLSPVSGKWGEGKMDLIALFIHRGLDLLTSGGILCFITSSYWLSAEGARKLRSRLAESENIVNFIDLGTAPVFQGLSGRHCIVAVSRGVRHPSPTSITTIKPEYESDPISIERLTDYPREVFDTVEVSDQRRLLDPDGVFHLGDRDVEAICRKMETGSIPLGQTVRSSQGVVDNPPELTERILRKLRDNQPELFEEMEYEAGEPVFLLPTDHPLLGELTDSERELARPFYKPSSVRPFALPPQLDAYLLYLTPTTCPDIDQCPNLKRHLDRYRPIMEQRREVKEGRIRWWHLHWSREAERFENEHLLAPQMVEYPTAARTEGPAYAGMSVQVLDKPQNVSIRFVEAVINSRAVRFWLDRGGRAKRRGLRLDMTLATLRKIPCPVMRPTADKTINAGVETLIKMYKKAFADSG